MVGSFFLEAPVNFSFRHTVQSHGWYDLDPFTLDEDKLELNYVLSLPRNREPIPVVISETENGVTVRYSTPRVDKELLTTAIKHILRLDDDLTGFYDLIEKGTGLDWVRSAKAGRLLRSASVFEDLVKTICTTNCSWSLTKKMVSNLVEKLGERASNGSRSFPTATAMAAMSDHFYRDEIRAGYRSPYLGEVARAVAAGDLDPEAWLNSELSTAELKKEMKRAKGVGDYAAENLLKLVGRYDGLALDSFLRGEFFKKHNKQKTCPDKKIEKHYKKFGDWKGLAIWCDMTERWFV